MRMVSSRRRRNNLLVVVPTVSLGGGGLLTAAFAGLGGGSLALVLGTVTGLAFVCFLVSAAMYPGESRALAALERDLAAQPWRLVEIVVLRGAPSEPLARIAALLDPSTGACIGTWLAEDVGNRRWLGRDRRVWAYAVFGVGRVLVTPPDRTCFLELGEAKWNLPNDALHAWAQDVIATKLAVLPAVVAGSTDAMSAPPTAPLTAEPAALTSQSSSRSLLRSIMVLGVLTAVALVASIYNQQLANRDDIHRARLLEDGDRTTAFVRGVSSSEKLGYDTVLLRFTSSGGEIDVSVRTGDIYAVRQGSTVEVAYDVGDPRDVVLVSHGPVNHRPVPLWLWIIVVCGVFNVVASWYLQPGRRSHTASPT
jgi:hypothetical protein